MHIERTIRINPIQSDKNILAYLLFWVVLSFNFFNPDYANYKDSYVRHLNAYEPIYNLLTHFFQRLGFPYEMYLPVLGIIIALLFRKAITQYTKAHWRVLLCILIAPMGLLVTQIRTFLAYALFYCAFSFLFEQRTTNGYDRKGSVWKFVILTLLCGGIQRTLWFYLIFAFVKKLTPRKLIFPLILYFVMYSYVFGNTDVLIAMLEKLDPIFPFYRSRFYLIESHVRPNINGLIATYTLYLVGLGAILVRLRNEYYEKAGGIRGSFWSYCNKTKSNCGILLRCYLMIIAVLPLCTIDTTFERLYFYLYPLIYMQHAESIEKSAAPSAKLYSKAVMATVSLFGVFYISFVNGKFNEIVVAMLRDNYVLNPFSLF